MIRKNIKQNIGLSGIATLIENGIEHSSKNAVTNIGLSEIVYALLDKSMQPIYFAIGTDDSNSSVANIALQSQLTAEYFRTKSLGFDVVLNDDGNYTFVVTNEFANSHQLMSPENWQNDPNFDGVTVKELGLFNRFRDASMALPSGNMFARSPITPLTMAYNTTYSGKWEIKINVQDIVLSGGIVFDGSRLVCEALQKFQKNAFNKDQYYNGEPTDFDDQTPCPWGINLISLGTNDTATIITDEDLKAPLTQYDTPPTITSLDLTNESTDINYEAKIIIQKYIPPNSVNQIIKEVGVFNFRSIRLGNDSTSSVRTPIRTMFSRVVLDTPIPANAEATLTWEIGFKRGL